MTPDSRSGKVEKLEIDFQFIDNIQWPCRGPIMNYMIFRKVANIDGICVYVNGVCVDSTVMKLGRGRAYEVMSDNHRHTQQLILGDIEFCDDIRCCGLYRLILLVRIAYGLELLGLRPENVIYPAGLYGESAERRALRYWMRPMEKSEIAISPPLTQGLARIAIGNGNLHGMYCLDSEKLINVYEDISSIRMCNVRHEKFGIDCLVRDITTKKIGMLLSAVQRDYEPWPAATSA